MALRTYSSKTLQDNWFKDRVQSEIMVGHQARLQGATLREFEPALSTIVPPKGNQAERFATVPRTYRHAMLSTARGLPVYNVGAMYETSSADQAGWARPPRSTAAHKPRVGMRQFGEIHKAQQRRRGAARGGLVWQRAARARSGPRRAPLHHHQRRVLQQAGGARAHAEEAATRAGR